MVGAIIIVVGCLVGLFFWGRSFINASPHDTPAPRESVRGRPSPDPQAVFVSERRIAEDTNRLIEEIEQFLAERER